MEINTTSNPTIAEKNGCQVSNSPISLLSRDLLWTIFSVNANMDQASEDDIPAIRTLRHTSQACSAWRRVVLTSPSLWGRVINLHWLEHEHWRKEIIHRTGESDLYVRGERSSNLRNLWSVTIPVLEENWSRIRSLDLDYDEDETTFFKYASDLWRLFKRSSNILESFRLALSDNGPYIGEGSTMIPSPPEFIFFDNHAPSLRVFVSPHMKYDLRAPWTSHIRHLSLSTPISVYELLDALTYMPLLETLENQLWRVAITHGDADRMRSIPKVVLPRLQHIVIYTPLEIIPYMTFLDHLEPADGRLLEFHSRPLDTDRYLDAQAISAASHVLSTYSRPLAASATEITLILLQCQFLFSVYLTGERSFSFNLTFISSLPNQAFYHLFSALNFSHFPHANILTLDLEDTRVLPSSPNIAQFLLSVASIEILDTTPETLRFLLRLPDDVLKAVFPLLQKIEILDPETEDVAAIQGFLSLRITLGRPVSTLSIRMQYPIDFRSLEQFSGLKVCMSFYEVPHKSGDYLCGSGHPELLLSPTG